MDIENSALAFIKRKTDENSIPLGHPEVIQVLEKLLADARSGRLSGVGVVAVEGNGSMNAIIAGSAALPVIYTGAGLLQASVMKQMTTKPSGLVVPVR